MRQHDAPDARLEGDGPRQPARPDGRHPGLADGGLHPGALGSSLESRQGWTYHVTTPLDRLRHRADLGQHAGRHAPSGAATTQTSTTSTFPATPTGRVADDLPGALWPMATLYEYVMVPRTGQQQFRSSSATQGASRSGCRNPRLDPEGEGGDDVAVPLRARQRAGQHGHRPPAAALLPLAGVGGWA